MAGSPLGTPRNSLLGAAVLKVLLRDGPAGEAARRLYEELLGALGLTDEAVEAYLRLHAGEVEEAIRRHGRIG